MVETFVALYHSTDKDDEEYWDVGQVANDYGITITDTGKKDWGGEAIFKIGGKPKALNKFATEYCAADSLVDLYPTNLENE